MIKRIAVMTLWLLVGLNLRAQETLITDSAWVPPFEGSIHYRIAYEGRGLMAKRAYLPDSLVMYVAGEGILLRYHGGLADSARQDLLWLRDSLQMVQIDHRWGEVWKMESGPFEPAKARKTGETADILEQACTAWELRTPEGAETVWLGEALPYPFAWHDSLQGNAPLFLHTGQGQLPLQMQRKAGITVTTTAVEVRPGPVPEGMLALPKGYKTGLFDPQVPFHPLVPRKPD